MAELTIEQKKALFVEKLSNLTGEAQELMEVWGYGEFSDFLNTNTKFLTAYQRVFNLSFDEWVSELTNFRDVCEAVLTPPPPRQFLAHLNISLPQDDPRTAARVEEIVKAIIEVGTEGAPEDIAPFDDISVTLVEEI